jgi:hypothetical protein
MRALLDGEASPAHPAQQLGDELRDLNLRRGRQVRPEPRRHGWNEG